MKQAMIFAAGLGTRLKPLTDTMPKALVPVDGQPLLWHVLTKLRQAGFTRIVVNVHHFAQQIADYLRANQDFGLDIAISDETSQLLDTGGAIKHARALFDSCQPVLIHNVDILSNADLGRLYDRASLTSPTGQPFDAVLLCSERPSKRNLIFGDMQELEGWVNNETHELKGHYAQLSPYEQQHLPLQRRLAFSGIHAIHPRVFSMMDRWPDRFSIIDFYLSLYGCYHVVCYEQQGLRLLDVGKLDTLDAAGRFLQSLQP